MMLLPSHIELTMTSHIARSWWLAGVVLLVLCSGCGSRKGNQDYTPSSQLATDTVCRALDAWKAGQPAGEVAGTSPVVYVTDGGRNPDQVLESFEILGETRGPAGRSFVVTLRLANPSEEIKTRYIVVGIDPLWVFRQEDFELLMHWDHRMPPTLPDDKAGAEGVTPATKSDSDSPEPANSTERL